MRTLVHEEVNSISGGSDWSDCSLACIEDGDLVEIPDECSPGTLAGAAAAGAAGGMLLGAAGALPGIIAGGVAGAAGGMVGAAVGCAVAIP